MSITETKIKEVFEAFKGRFAWKNAMQAPRLEKIVVSVGSGRMRKDKQKVEIVEDRLKKITGQKASPRKAKQSIASFKLREGEIIGHKVTLRGRAMHAFLDRLIHIAIPRMRDFRGIPRTAVDAMGNLTIGIPEHTVFPETPDENLQDIFGLSVTLVTTTKDKDEALEFLLHLGVPFVRE